MSMDTIRFFRIVSASDAAAGRMEQGLIVGAESEGAARSTYASDAAPIRILPSDVLVELLTEDQIRAKRSEIYYTEAWMRRRRADEDRREASRRSFISTLENLS